MASYPGEFEFDVLLKDGKVVHMRPIRPDDAEREQRFFGRVGSESALLRFHRPKSELTPEELRYFTNLDYDDRMAFIAVDNEEMVAVGRYDVATRPLRMEARPQRWPSSSRTPTRGGASGARPKEVREAYGTVTSAVDDATGAIVQQFVPEGHEVIVGMTEDPTFGPLVVFGLGGIYVELLQDVAFRINPITVAEVRDMIQEPKSSQLLFGYRGAPLADIEAVEELLLRFSAMIDDLPEIAEMDMSPIKVLPPRQGVCAVDTRIMVRAVQGSFLPSRKDIPGRML